ncbi:MAG: class I SAM-dependent methyltransferase [Candidatus Azambacteria bacterium]|nr:class I SAM-dependent methyltransferase [Candidatus Azambacteria bacterium]
MLFQPDRYLLKKQIKANAHYIKGVVLDAGSGDGERYKKLFKFDKYVTLDINSAYEADIIGSVENIPAKSESFDSVVSTQVLEHVKNPQKAVHEFYRVLKTGGYCLATIPQLNELHSEPHDYFRFTRYGLEEIFSNAGFKITLIDQRGGFWAANAQMRIRYTIDLFRLQKIRPLRWIFQPFILLNGIVAILFDYFDKSRANRKHAIGWLIIAQK